MSTPSLSHTGGSTPISVPGSDLYVQVDTRELEKRFEVLPQQISIAAQRAANRTRDWLRTQLRRELAGKTWIPHKNFKGRFRRGGRGGEKTYSNEGFAILWIGLSPVEASKAGRPRQTKKGTRTGHYFFDRAFVAEIYGGEKVWMRKGAKRFPVVKMTIPIHEEMEEILPRYEAPAAAMFQQRLEHELLYLLRLAA